MFQDCKFEKFQFQEPLKVFKVKVYNNIFFKISWFKIEHIDIYIFALKTFNGPWNWNFTNLQFWNTHNSSVDENYGKKKNSVQPNSMKNPQKPSVLKNLWFWRSFAIYKLVDIGNMFSAISSHRQHAGDPKFQHRNDVRCRIRWQWNFWEIRKFYHFSE